MHNQDDQSLQMRQKSTWRPSKNQARWHSIENKIKEFRSYNILYDKTTLWFTWHSRFSHIMDNNDQWWWLHNKLYMHTGLTIISCMGFTSMWIIYIFIPIWKIIWDLLCCTGSLCYGNKPLSEYPELEMWDNMCRTMWELCIHIPESLLSDKPSHRQHKCPTWIIKQNWGHIWRALCVGNFPLTMCCFIDALLIIALLHRSFFSFLFPFIVTYFPHASHIPHMIANFVI